MYNIASQCEAMGDVVIRALVYGLASVAISIGFKWYFMGPALWELVTKAPTIREGMIWHGAGFFIAGALYGFSRGLSKRWQRWGLAAGASTLVIWPVWVPTQLMHVISLVEVGAFTLVKMTILMIVGAIAGALVDSLRDRPAKAATPDRTKSGLDEVG